LCGDPLIGLAASSSPQSLGSTAGGGPRRFLSSSASISARHSSETCSGFGFFSNFGFQVGVSGLESSDWCLRCMVEGEGLSCTLLPANSTSTRASLERSASSMALPPDMPMLFHLRSMRRRLLFLVSIAPMAAPPAGLTLPPRV
jgi:hypothetical protein